MKIAVASGKGGTGKTFISTNLFNVLQKRNNSLILVDCDAEEPNDGEFFADKSKVIKSFDVTQKVPVIDATACTYCGKCQDYCSYNAILFLKEAAIVKVIEDLCHGCGACSVACDYGAISEREVLLGRVIRYQITDSSVLIESRMKVGVYSPVSVIKKALKEAGDAEIVILDSPPGTSCSFIQTVVAADYVVLVTEPTPFGLSNLMQSVETLKSIGKSCGVVLNRAGLGNDEVNEYLRLENIPLLMSIPFDREIAMCYSKGELLTNQNAHWEVLFNQLYLTILKDYANSSH